MKIINAALLAALVTLPLAGCGGEPERPTVIRPVRAVRIADFTELEGRTFPGRAKATEEVNIAFEVSGRLIERPVDVGSVVAEGDLLARLDPRDFQNELAAAEAQRDQAKAYFDRIEEAAKTGAVAQQEVTDARAGLDVAAATVRIKEKALADARVVAPFAGTIAATFVENFQNVQAKEAVVRLLDTSRIEMTINVPEGVISLAPLVTEVVTVFDAFPDQEVRGTIKDIGTEASETTRTFPVTLIMDQPEGFRILPGMTGRASGRGEVLSRLAREGFEVSMSSIFQGEDDKSYVWAVDEDTGHVTRVEIGLGDMTPRGVLVTGVEPGDWIATAGVHYLEEGQQVRIMGPPMAEASP